MIQRQNNLQGLHSDLISYAFDLSNEVSKSMQRDILITEGYRTKEVQEAYYAQGRKTLSEVNQLRQKAGLYLLSSDKENYIISWALPCESPHQHYAAFDVYLLTADGKKLDSNGATLQKFYDIMKSLALSDKYKNKIELGLFWSQYGQLDPPHVEIKNWRSVKKDSINACKMGINAQPEENLPDVDEKKNLTYKALQIAFALLLAILVIKLMYGKH